MVERQAGTAASAGPSWFLNPSEYYTVRGEPVEPCCAAFGLRQAQAERHHMNNILSIPAFTGEEKTSSRKWTKSPAMLGIAKRPGSG